MTDSTLNYGWEMWTLLYKLQKKLYRTEMDIWRRAARTFRLLKVRNEGIRGKNGSNTNNFGKTGQHVEMIRIHSTHEG
jgi:hypothetical protein